jgi:hypothetical protein
MTKCLHMLIAAPLLIIMGQVTAAPNVTQCSHLIDIANQGKILPQTFYQKNTPTIQACLNNCSSLYSGSDNSICQSSLQSLAFNAKLSSHHKNNDTSTSDNITLSADTTTNKNIPSNTNNETDSINASINTHLKSETTTTPSIRWD